LAVPAFSSFLVALKPQVVELAPGVHSIFGFAGYNVAVVEGESGLIIYGTSEKPEDGEMVLELVRQLSTKPIVAVAYSHSHCAH
jgi:alkyl sulfatase BDS1-like metallo-beta-lactamase superfamily hydrolase